jgi:hypothetical protein
MQSPKYKPSTTKTKKKEKRVTYKMNVCNNIVLPPNLNRVASSLKIIYLRTRGVLQ